MPQIAFRWSRFSSGGFSAGRKSAEVVRVMIDAPIFAVRPWTFTPDTEVTLNAHFWLIAVDMAGSSQPEAAASLLSGMRSWER